MQKLLSFLIFSSALFAQANVLQAQKIQLQCKAKAKEVAQSSYTSCLNEAREDELEKVKHDYKEKLDKLKTYYNKKIKSLAASDSEIKKPNKPSTTEFPTVPDDKKTNSEETTTEELTNSDGETN